MDDSCAEKAPPFDLSKIAFPNKREEMVLWEVVLKCVIVGALLLVAVVGNTLVIVIVFLFPKMRTTTNYYVVNLAIADLLVACFPMWIHVTTDVTDGFILGDFFCKFNAFVQTSAISAISFTMMVIAGDRFFAIVFPLKARVTQRKVKVVVFFVWLFAFSIGIPPAVFYQYTERQWLNYTETFCTDVWPMVETSEGCDHGATSERVYWTITVAALNWIPMVMMTVNYTLIIHKLRFARVAAHRGQDAISIIQRRSATRVIKMLFSLLVVFMVCTIPFQVSTLYENYKDKGSKLQSWYQPVYFSAVTLMFAHSSINPIIYGAMNQSFRTGFRHLMDRIRGRDVASWDYTINGGGTDPVKRPGIHVIDRSGSGNKSLSIGDVNAKTSSPTKTTTVGKSPPFQRDINIANHFDSTPIISRRRQMSLAEAELNSIADGEQKKIKNDNGVIHNTDRNRTSPGQKIFVCNCDTDNVNMSPQQTQHQNENESRNGTSILNTDEMWIGAYGGKNGSRSTTEQPTSYVKQIDTDTDYDTADGKVGSNGSPHRLQFQATDIPSELNFDPKHESRNSYDNASLEELVLTTTYLNQALVVD